ncbi:MAG: tripartite tricarboxylate transporter substrate binding protein [Burkholderiaceae bacterium]|nr:tripartite tricarboxylate transporter substrate binding protein [Burkholderiaceae bacterium]
MMAIAQQVYPSRPVSVVVPYSPGGTTDIIARLTAQYIGASMNKTFVVENKAGGSGTIAMGLVAKAAPDGYTLLSNEMTQTVVPALFPKLPFDPVKDLTTISIIAEAPYVLVINTKVPATNLSELVSYAKANPGKLNFASVGSGSGPHIAGELLKSVAGISMTHIAYKGSGPAVQDLLSGQVDVLITAAPTVAQHMGSGRIRALAVAHKQRITLLPNVPTSAEAGFPGFTIANWFGLAAPRGTPPAIINQLHGEVLKMLAKPDFREKLIAAGAEAVGMGPADAAKHVEAEAKRWSELIANAGIKLE